MAVGIQRDWEAALSAVSRVSPVGRTDRVSPVSPIRPELGLADLRPDPALIPVGDITQFESLVFGAQGRLSAVSLLNSSSVHSSVQPGHSDCAADRIELTLMSMRGRIDL